MLNFIFFGSCLKSEYRYFGGKNTEEQKRPISVILVYCVETGTRGSATVLGILRKDNCSFNAVSINIL